MSLLAVAKEDSPAYLSILFAINAETDINKKRPKTYSKDISNSLRLISDFEDLRAIAIDRVEWKSFKKCSFYFGDLFIFETATNKVLRIAVYRYFEL